MTSDDAAEYWSSLAPNALWKSLNPQPNPAVGDEYLGVLTAKFLPDGGLWVALATRPKLTRKERRILARDCLERLRSLALEGVTERYTWNEVSDGRLQAHLRLVYL